MLGHADMLDDGRFVDCTHSLLGWPQSVLQRIDSRYWKDVITPLRAWVGLRLCAA